MSRSEFRFRGQGGQGIITLCLIYGRAAALYDEKDVVMTEAYGPEITGGFAKSDIIMQDGAIDYPLVDHPDFLIVLSREAWLAERGNLPSNATVIYDEDLIEIPEEERGDHNYYGVPALKVAQELGRKVVANVVMLGAMSTITGIITPEAVEKALADRIPKGTEELNFNALKKGIEIGKELKGGN